MNGGVRKWFAAVLLLFAACGLQAVEGKLVATLSRNQEDQWNHILPDRPPQVATVDSVVPGQPFSICLFLHDFSLKNGAADVTADLEQIDPNGKRTALGRDLVAYRGKTDRKGVFLATLRFSAAMEESDPPGKYRILVRLHDRNAGGEKQLECSWLLTSPPKRFPAVDLKKGIETLTGYYRAPEPNLLPGVLESCLREISGLSGNTMPVYCELGLLFGMNPQLHGELLRIAAAQQTAERRRAVAAVIHFLGEEAATKLRPELDAETRRELDGLARLPRKVPEKIQNPGELDQLWAEFFAAGKVEPIRRLVGELARSGEMLTPEEFKAKKEKGSTTPDDLPKLMNCLIFTAANWSLNANAKQHPLVRYYLEAMLSRGELKNSRTALLVQEILRNASTPAKSGNIMPK